MSRKVVITAITGVLLVTFALSAAQKQKGKKPAEKQAQQTKAVEQQTKRVDLLGELEKAYQANDREKMGDIIKQMKEHREAVREKRQQARQFNKWHRQAHRRWAMRGERPGGNQWQRPRGGQRCPMGNRPCAMGQWGPGGGGQKQMRGWGQGPNQGWGQEPGPRPRPQRGDGPKEFNWEQDW